MRRAVAAHGSSYLRKPTEADGREFVDCVLREQSRLEPFVYASETVSAYRTWIAKGNRVDVEQFLVCRREDDVIVGFVNINNMTGGALQSGALGWASFTTEQPRGHLTEGVAMVLEVAFTQLRLHRLEANIQPSNERSRRLAIRAGFRLEGFSPRFLQIGGEWRDHERWAVSEEDWRDRRRRRRTEDR
ncbi:GNAT family N-acetyltransferase [Actinospongicola halichondriae]|uniref:GNAT family N-acetyltransferase n=1 Tax=Actinospongicola halichondriae TaxID=3236844 RepID=UPI003D4B44C2